jgi:hypothetical protein
MFVSLLTADQQQQNNFDHFSGSFRDITELNQESDTTTTIIIDNSSNTNIKTILNEDDTRETWSNNCDYLITTLGGLIGLGKYIFKRNFIFILMILELLDR